MADSFEDIEVWKRSCRLAVFVYETLKHSNDFALRDQMQRAAVSIASNIAEGYERPPKDFIRFLIIAKGSAAELRTQIYIAQKIAFVSNDQANFAVEETRQISKMLQTLIHRRRQFLRDASN